MPTGIIYERPIGIVLAGGESTRLPFKIFLATRKGRPVFSSAVEACLRLRIRPTICVHQRHLRLAREMLYSTFSAKYHKRFSFVDDNFHGIAGVLANLKTKRRHMLVFCGDNIYGTNTLVNTPRLLPSSYAAVNPLALRTCSQLDGYSFSKRRWVSRTENPDVGLTTPWYFRYEELSSMVLRPTMGILDILNALNCQPLVIEDPEWRDMGTPQSVEDYYAYYQGRTAESR